MMKINKLTLQSRQCPDNCHFKVTDSLKIIFDYRLNSCNVKYVHMCEEKL